MVDFITGLFIDLSLLGGIILFVLSFSKKYKKHRAKMLVSSVVLIAIGIIFIDTAALSVAYQNGMEASKSMTLD